MPIVPRPLAVGEVVNQWTVLSEPSKLPSDTHSHVLCRCSCGTEKRVRLSYILHGCSKGCGCLRDKASGARVATHRQSNSPEHVVWMAIKARCTNPSATGYENYGGRGITVCARWMDSFECFLEDMGPRPKGASIDRINNDLGYQPGNCRWADRKTQANNTRRSRKLTFNGKTLGISEWARQIGIEESSLRERLSRGWSTEEALTTPNVQACEKRRRAKA